ncbi:hypothetical protein VCHA35O142_60059 [Vibrio chagasii]|nr:hypothetical protein VCHA35O142_60059 [Vibrio chagasii]
MCFAFSSSVKNIASPVLVIASNPLLMEDWLPNILPNNVILLLSLLIGFDRLYSF